MTPILKGRFQIRSLLVLFVAVPITLLVSVLLSVPNWVLGLGLVLAIGFGYVMDIVCNYLQQKRWDSDWPPVLFLMSGVVEFALLLFSMNQLLPTEFFAADVIALHFWSIWTVSYLCIQHVFHPLKPLYKYSGGRMLAGTDFISRLDQNP